MKYFLQRICSLDCIHQWSERDSIIKESVSQHSFKVAAIANYILTLISLDDDAIKDARNHYDEFLDFKGNVLSYAIMHDFDEAIFGRDVSHTVKYNPYNGEHIRKAIDEYVEHTLETEFFGLMKAPSHVVKRFVKLCDWLALLTFTTRNQNMGAKTFSNEDIYCRENIVKSMKEVEELLYSNFGIKVELNLYIKLDEL